MPVFVQTPVIHFLISNSKIFPLQLFTNTLPILISSATSQNSSTGSFVQLFDPIFLLYWIVCFSWLVSKWAGVIQYHDRRYLVNTIQEWPPSLQMPQLLLQSVAPIIVTNPASIPLIFLNNSGRKSLPLICRPYLSIARIWFLYATFRYFTYRVEQTNH